MDEETYNHKLRLLAIYQDNLRELEVQAARFGANPPLNLFNEIKYHRKNIDDIRIQLPANAEEVTFDKLLISIEELRKFVRDEVKRAVDASDDKNERDYAYSQGLVGLFSAGMLISLGVAYLYDTYINGVQSNGIPKNVGSIVVFVICFAISIAITIRVGARLIRKSRGEFIHRIGYDPHEPRER
jgi:hypothetical protein